MGGFGSGRWGWHSKKTTVEDCKTLDLHQLAREGSFVAWRTASLRWLRGEQETGSIGYTVRPRGDGLLLVLSYRWNQAGGEWQSIELPIPLETTRPRLGGLRWWGRCPLAVSGVACRRRVAKLYLPPVRTAPDTEASGRPGLTHQSILMRRFAQGLYKPMIPGEIV
jgi:hypothetical protein